jgi:hypothetical protein
VEFCVAVIFGITAGKLSIMIKEGKPVEKRGRKASGLQRLVLNLVAKVAGLPVRQCIGTH